MTTKYFVARMNGWMLMLVLGVPLLVSYSMDFHFVPEEWDLPMSATCMGTVIAVSVVQPWLRQTMSFWLSLVISFTVQWLVGHWISVHEATHSRGELNGATFLVILAGYAMGTVLFLLVQGLKPKEEPQGDPLLPKRDR